MVCYQHYSHTKSNTALHCLLGRKLTLSQSKPGHCPSPHRGGVLLLFSRLWGALVSFVVSLPLQLCIFSNTFPLKIFRRQKPKTAALRRVVATGWMQFGGGCCAEPCLVAFSLCAFYQPGKDGGRSSRGNPEFLTPEEPNG